MKNYINLSKSLSLSIVAALMIGAGALVLSSCEVELPAAGSVEDMTPPKADFSSSADNTNSKLLIFSNLSASSTDYIWDFGDGNTSYDKDPTNLYPAEGTYAVTLTASDKLGVTSITTKDVLVTVPQVYEPFILEPGFESFQLENGTGDGRDSWRAPSGSRDDRPLGMGNVIQITGSPVSFGDSGAKLPSDNTRCGYQLITVIPDSDYKVTFYYTMKTTPAGTLTVAILGGEVTDPADVAAATLASVTVNDQTDDSAYVKASVDFNSGSNTGIVIYFTNVDVETRVDEFTIENN